jgi:hypothetical protein
MLHVIDGEKKRGKERRKKEEKKKKKRRKNQLFCYILRPIFVGGACGGPYGRGALAPPHNPSDPTKLALRLISTHYSMLGVDVINPVTHALTKGLSKIKRPRSTPFF